jgi:hypothetical protein
VSLITSHLSTLWVLTTLVWGGFLLFHVTGHPLKTAEATLESTLNPR